VIEIQRAASRIAVVAIGGNSLIKPEQFGTIAEQFDNARGAAEQMVELVAAGWNIAVVHGNGPQVGFILRRSEMAPDVAPALSLDMCDADSEGGIGYILQQSIDNELRRRGLNRQVVALITQVVVDPTDPAFDRPEKPIGQYYEGGIAADLRRDHGWAMAEEPGRGWRRLAPSPRPREIIELDAIRMLVERGVVTICAGGGGIPVIIDAESLIHGVEAVVDKDLASALLGRALGAELLLISTGVERICLDWGTPQQRPIERITASEAQRYLAEGQFPAGSMGPKVEAALDFMRDRGGRVLVTDFLHIREALRGETGTLLVPDDIAAESPSERRSHP
jgi:carbamate kinase